MHRLASGIAILLFPPLLVFAASAPAHAYDCKRTDWAGPGNKLNCDYIGVYMTGASVSGGTSSADIYPYRTVSFNFKLNDRDANDGKCARVILKHSSGERRRIAAVCDGQPNEIVNIYIGGENAGPMVTAGTLRLILKNGAHADWNFWAHKIGSNVESLWYNTALKN